MKGVGGGYNLEYAEYDNSSEDSSFGCVRLTGAAAGGDEYLLGGLCGGPKRVPFTEVFIVTPLYRLKLLVLVTIERI